MQNRKLKWEFYERRSELRDFYFHKIIRRHIFEKRLNKDPYIPFYANRWVMGKRETNCQIAAWIKDKKPFMVARFGNTELAVITSVLKRRLFGNTLETQARLDEWFQRLVAGAGFFPNNQELADIFTDIMHESSKEIDMIAMFHCHLDDYVITEWIPEGKVTFLNHIEPWRCDEPWSSALEGKKVLVIHPFEESIRSQYRRREMLFPGTKVLPQFELKTLKAVQTIAGERDERFDTWFEALEYMYEEAMRIDFDTAIIGCGAYGLTLAAKLKAAGKQAIHMGGATQILFGVKGRRWVDNPRAGLTFNEEWVYPLESETPKNCNVVENHCYW